MAILSAIQMRSNVVGNTATLVTDMVKFVDTPFGMISSYVDQSNYYRFANDIRLSSTLLQYAISSYSLNGEGLYEIDPSPTDFYIKAFHSKHAYVTLTDPTLNPNNDLFVIQLPFTNPNQSAFYNVSALDPTNTIKVVAQHVYLETRPDNNWIKIRHQLFGDNPGWNGWKAISSYVWLMSGDWRNSGGTYQDPITGAVDIRTGSVTCDYTWVTQGDAFGKTNNRALSGFYTTNHPVPAFEGFSHTTANTRSKSSSGGQMEIIGKDNKTFHIEVTALSAQGVPGTYTFFSATCTDYYPYHTKILETNYDFISATLSGCAQQGIFTPVSYEDTEEYSAVWFASASNSNYWVSLDRYSTADTYMGTTVWTTPHYTLPGSAPLALSGHWSDMSKVKVRAHHDSGAAFQDPTDVFYISVSYAPAGIFNDAPYRTMAVYDMLVDPLIEEDIKILPVSASNSKEILRLVRTAQTSGGSYYELPPKFNFNWKFSQAATGLSGASILYSSQSLPTFPDLEDQSYYQVWSVPVSGQLSNITPGINSVIPVNSVQNDYVWGGEYLVVNYPNNDNPTIIVATDANGESDSYNLRRYFVPSINQISINTSNNDNSNFIRRYELSAVYSGGDWHPFHKFIWNLQPDQGTILSAFDAFGNSYDVTRQDGITESKITVYLTSPYWNGTDNPITKTNWTVGLSVMKSSPFISPASFDASGNTIFQTNYFIGSSFIYPQFKFNSELPNTTDGWRIGSPTYGIFLQDVSITNPLITNYDPYFTLADGQEINSSIISQTLDTSMTGVSTFNLELRNVQTGGFTNPFNVTAIPFRLHSITQWLSSHFIVYPTYSFINGDNPATDLTTGTNYTLSPGASAYDQGHTETFNLSAGDLNGVLYDWSVSGNEPPKTSISNIALTEIGTYPVKLSVYNDVFPIGMPAQYYTDGNQLVNYPNRETTTTNSNSNKLFQHIRIVDYDTPTLQAFSVSSLLVPLDNYSTITATKTAIPLSGSPVHSSTFTTIWSISSPTWTSTVRVPGNTLTYTVSIGDGLTPGTLKFGQRSNIVVYCETNVKGLIYFDGFQPQDFITSNQYATSNFITIDAQALPELSIYTTTSFATTGENVIIDNLTTDNGTGLLSAFIWDDGFNPVQLFSGTTAFRSLTTSYSEYGVYDITLSAITSAGTVYSHVFEEFISIIPLPSFSDDVGRIFGITELNFPNTLRQTQVPPNEWITYRNINRTFEKLIDNLQYLKNVSTFFSPPPKYFDGWLGSVLVDDITTFGNTLSVLQWNVDVDGLNTYYSTLSSALDNASLSAVSFAIVKNNQIYTADNNSFNIYSNTQSPDSLGSTFERNINDPFGQLVSFDINSQGRYYILDKQANRVAVMSFVRTRNPQWKTHFYWGTLGGALAKNGFQNPTDIVVDDDDNVWVADSGNKCIKVYNRTGSWIQTFTHDVLSQNDIISVDVNSSGEFFVLLQNAFVKFNADGTLDNKFDFNKEILDVITPTNLPQKLELSYDDGFVYITLQDRVFKMTADKGVHSGVFAISSGFNYKGIYQDENFFLYIANGNNILRYFDPNEILTVYEDHSDIEWTSDDVFIDKNEYINPWVINRTLARMWDKIEIFRRSLRGKVVFTTLETGISGFAVEDFSPTEYQNLYLTPKEEIFIGVNELVTRDVFNRCITNIYNDMQNILDNL